MAADDDDEPQCRICFCPEEDPRDPLIEPCLCKGSMALVHRSCLDACRVKGFDPSSLSRCGLCKHEYELEGVGRRAGPRTELAVIVFRYVGLRFLAFLGAAARRRRGLFLGGRGAAAAVDLESGAQIAAAPRRVSRGGAVAEPQRRRDGVSRRCRGRVAAAPRWCLAAVP